MNNVNYRVLKSNIIKACSAEREGSMKFTVDMDKLTELVSSLNLIPLPVGETSHRVLTSDIPYISEYFEKTRLSWFSDSKYTTVITFIDSTNIDDTATELIEKLNTPQVEDPEDDKVKDFATLVANYYCYFATIVSYQNEDPARNGRPSYEIACRANKVVIKASDYQYNPKDFS